MQKFTKYAPKLVLKYCLKWENKLYHKLKNAKKMIPKELLIARTILSEMVFVGNLWETFDTPCKYLNNMVFIFATLIPPTSGGHTICFDGEKNLYKSVHF